MKRIALAVFLVLLDAPPAAAQPAGRPAGIDISDRFAPFGPPTALDEAAITTAFARVQPQVAGLTVIIVPSWLSGPLLDLRSVGISDYFLAIDQALTKAGARVIVADVNTAAGIAINGPHIAASCRRPKNRSAC
jgi:hypothetical protein